MITAENKAKAIAATQKHGKDVGSAEAQVSVITVRIAEITEHLKANKHDHMGRRGLKVLIGRRNKLLKFLEKNNFESYKALVSTLKLRRK